MPFIAPKGSVLDGVSLTVNEVSGTRFGVNIIPHTLARTSFTEAQSGQQMSI
jgi:riboflavin synthase